MTTVGSDGRLRVNVLREPTVVYDGEPVPMRSRLQRRLLLRLACHRGAVVSRNDLVAALWDSRPPRTAYELLSTHATRLRSQLAPLIVGADDNGFSPIPRSEDGYRLNLVVLGCDLAELADCAEDLRHRPDSGALVRGLNALSLVGERSAGSGPADEDEPAWLNAAIQSGWDDVRTICEAVVDGAPTDGAQPGEQLDWSLLLPVLTRLAEQSPYDEPVIAWRIEALARTGRTAEALRLMEETRARLADELGAAPADRLTTAFQVALDLSGEEPVLRSPAAEPTRHQASPPIASPVSPTGGPTVSLSGPRQLPLPPAEFAGREAQLDELAGRLTAPADGPAVVMITGAPGVGKSALAAAAANRIKDAFPDGQVYLDLTGLSEDELVAALVPAVAELGATVDLGLPAAEQPDRLVDQAALLRSLGADKRILWIFDNVEPRHSLAALLPTARGAAVLITGTGPHPDLIGQPLVDLDPLDLEAGRDLLGSIIGADRIGEESDAVDALLALCEGRPGAVLLAARQVATHPHRTLAETSQRYADPGRRLAELAAGGHGLRRSLERARAGLSSSAAAALAALGVNDAEACCPADLSGWLGIAEDTARDLLEDLVEARLIEVRGTRTGRGYRYCCDGFVRQYGRELAAGIAGLRTPPLRAVP